MTPMHTVSARSGMPVSRRRRGLTTPAFAGILIVVMLGVALILDRLWLEAVRLELITAAEAAALSAGRELASDELLKVDATPRRVADQAVQSAIMAALQNRAAGMPVSLEEQDVVFPQLVAAQAAETGSPWSSSDTDIFPKSVIVTAQRTRFRGNPVALWITELTRQPFGDAVGQAAATITGPVIGVRPLEGSAVPALPLAIWLRDPTGERQDTWQAAIEMRLGRDDFRYDAENQRVVEEPDGIPELTLRTIRPGGPWTEANMRLLDIGSQFHDDRLEAQWKTGWTAADLAEWGGELRIDSQRTTSTEDVEDDSTSFHYETAASDGDGEDDEESPAGLRLRGLPQLESNDRDALQQQLGIPRIALLYSAAEDVDGQPWQQVECVQFVAIRVLQVVDLPDGSCRITIQPTVMATRTAIVGTDAGAHAPLAQPACLYRLQLSDIPTVVSPPEDLEEIAIGGDQLRS